MNLTPHDAQRLAGVLLEEGSDDAAFAGQRLAPGPFSRYSITRLVGVGGMGEVYEARQANPDRRVAIKVIRPDHISPDLLRRFEHETRILARLQHPGIAPIYEAGQAQVPGGTVPFFAMEYVDGRPLTAFASDSNLPIRERLDLFLLVCDAVEHAHRKGIIHRDLKPANILIDAQGKPRILDFGIARATDSDIQTTTMHTEVGKLVGTLPYMSPEQASGDADELDTRSDVYSLGVILYELLSGRPPYDFSGPGRRLIPQALRAILETEPTPLSSISRVFRGDLETIVGKALAKEKERRYQSVGELAGDVSRYLTDEPIQARPAGVWYQLGKIARRHRGPVVVIVSSLVLVLGGAAIASWQAIRATKATSRYAEAADRATQQSRLSDQRREEAERSREIASAISDFLRQMLSAARPEELGRDAKVRDVVKNSIRMVPTTMKNQPDLEAQLHMVLADTLWALGDAPEEGRELRKAVAAAERAGEGSDRTRMQAFLNLGSYLSRSGALDEADQAFEQGTAIAEHFERADPDVLKLRTVYAIYLRERSDLPKARSTLEDVISICDRGDETLLSRKLEAQRALVPVLTEQGAGDRALALAKTCYEGMSRLEGPRAPPTLVALDALLSVLLRFGNAADAVPYARTAADITVELYGPTHKLTLARRHNLATLQMTAGEKEGGIASEREVLEASERFLGENDPGTLAALESLAYMLRETKAFEEAESLARTLVERQTARYGAESAQVARGLQLQMGLAWDQKRLSEAESIGRRLVALRRSLLGDRNPQTLIASASLAAILLDEGDAEKGSNLLRELLPLAEEVLPKDDPDIAAFSQEYGRGLLMLGQYAEAEQRLLYSDRILGTASGRYAKKAAASKRLLGDLYTAWNKPDEAAKYRATVQEERPKPQ